MPMLREGLVVGSIWVGRGEVGSFPDKLVKLLQTFADQAVIAIENVRLFNETKAALEQQTATAEILRVISESPSDLQPVFHAIVKTALRLFHVSQAGLALREGNSFRVMSKAVPGQPIAGPFPDLIVLDTDANFPSRVILNKEVLHLADWDVIDLPPFEQGVRDQEGFRASLVLPIQRGSECIGAFAIMRNTPGAFSDKEVALMHAFVHQAEIAIENVRLSRETQEALEQQTAMAEILKVISESPTDLQPVFDTITKRAMALCGARIGVLTRVDGELLHLVAYHGASEESAVALRAAFPTKLEHKTRISARAVLDRAPVNVPDVFADSNYTTIDAARLGGYRSLLAVPMLRENQVLGTINVARAEQGLFPENLVKLLQTFADQAVIAIENVRLFNETKEALEQQTATAEVLKVISSSVADTAPVFEKILDSCLRLFTTDQAGVFLIRDDVVYLEASRGTGFGKSSRYLAMF
ncbi:MAG: GAF domain-containing protein [Gammaproteobacteria bacterium]|nr:GAF domain-containing protein [Gammaproteobacteria bacterium]